MICLGLSVRNLKKVKDIFSSTVHTSLERHYRFNIASRLGYGYNLLFYNLTVNLNVLYTVLRQE